MKHFLRIFVTALSVFISLISFSIIADDSNPVKITAKNRVRDTGFGRSVAISKDGSFIIAGASHEQKRMGGAHIFEKQGASFKSTHIIPDRTVGAFQEFGADVAISGDGKTALVGSPYDSQAGKWSGAVYVYTRSGSQWKSNKIRPRSLRAGDYFGEALSISTDGNLWVAGASRKDIGRRDAGVVYTFSRRGKSWKESMLRHPRPNANDTFGHDVALSGDGSWLAVSAHTAGPVGRFKGQVFLFKRALNRWKLLRRIQPSGLTESAVFGQSLELSNDGSVLVVSAAQQKTTGRVFIYSNVNSSGNPKPDILVPDKDVRFGSVAISGDGDLVLVADTGQSKVKNGGVVYRYKRSRNNWSSDLIRPNSPFKYAGFGGSMAISNDSGSFVVGAMSYDWFGAVFVYEN